MEKILKQPQFDKYSTLLYNSIWLSDQNKIGLVYHATISFSIKTFFAFALKIKKILRQQGGRHSPLSSFALFQFLFQTRDLVKASFKEQFSINIGIRNFSAKTVKNKPKHPKPKPKPKQKKAKHKTTSSKPITKDLTECEADMQLADFLTKRKKKKKDYCCLPATKGSVWNSKSGASFQRRKLTQILPQSQIYFGYLISLS